MTKSFYSNSGLKRLFLKNNVNDQIGIDDSLLDYKVMYLFTADSDNCTIEYTLDLNLYDERKERIQSLMDDAGDCLFGHRTYTTSPTKSNRKEKEKE